jgi:hypothetical protein
MTYLSVFVSYGPFFYLLLPVVVVLRLEAAPPAMAPG